MYAVPRWKKCARRCTRRCLTLHLRVQKWSINSSSYTYVQTSRSNSCKLCDFMPHKALKILEGRTPWLIFICGGGGDIKVCLNLRVCHLCWTSLPWAVPWHSDIHILSNEAISQCVVPGLLNVIHISVMETHSYLSLNFGNCVYEVTDYIMVR
jgi:hypothetical protein